MPAHKHPRRDEYDAELAKIAEVIPRNYAGLIRHYRPDLQKRRIYDARHGALVDFEILNELKRVARESVAARQLVPA